VGGRTPRITSGVQWVTALGEVKLGGQHP
jgi:hypothetical protein